MQKQEQYKNLLRFGLSLVIWGATTAVWAWSWMAHFADTILRPFGYKGNWLVFAIYAALSLLFNNFYGGYRIGFYRKQDVVYSGALALIITNAITYVQTCLVGRAIMSAFPFLQMTLIQLVLVWLWASLAGTLYARAFRPHDMLLIYGDGAAAETLRGKLEGRSEKYRIREAVGMEQGMEAVLDKLGKYRAAVFCEVSPNYRSQLLKYCFQNRIRVYNTPTISDIFIRGAAEINLFDTPLLLCRNQGISFEQRAAKRLVDLCVSAVGLIVFSPFMLLCALAVKLCDGGPILYRQRRLTEGGRAFDVYKFRSMIVDAEKRTGATLAAQNDSRITPVGRVIRALRLDELPQIWNIFRGDMSLVGPRPERPELTAEHLKTMPEFEFRLRMKAGLTGLAQVNGNYNTTAYDKLKMDLMYISNYSLVLDLRIILMTIKILFQRERTEGVADRPADNPHADERNHLR